MSSVLITGASGFIGSALARSMAAEHEVICMSRRGVEIPGTIRVRGDFAEFEDLCRLDGSQIDVAVHLGAVTGGCLERDGYGLSKHLMEQITEYHARQNPETDVVNLRLSTVSPDDAKPAGVRDHGPWCLGGITVTLLSDVVRLFTAAAEAPHRPGARTMNATCSSVWSTAPGRVRREDAGLVSR